MFDLKPTYSVELKLELWGEKKKKVFNTHEAENPDVSFVWKCHSSEYLQDIPAQ